jgi:hypothetical protein
MDDQAQIIRVAHAALLQLLQLGKPSAFDRASSIPRVVREPDDD